MNKQERDPKKLPTEVPESERIPETLDVVGDVDLMQLQHFVTTIKTAEQQVGENIIQALQHNGTVAVLTTVVIGPDGLQRIVSAALKPKLLQQVQHILTDAKKERIEEEPCVGFHCLTKPKIDLSTE